jgi:hypothetical protein
MRSIPRPRRHHEDGFVLATAILAMVVMGAAVAAGYFIANQEYHVGKSMRKSLSAFYGAQAGLQREIATWPTRQRWNAMQGGDSVLVGPITLPNGVGYRGVVTRVDNVPETDPDRERYYLIRMRGAAAAPFAGEEVGSLQAMMLRVRYYDFCCSAAITAKDTLELAGAGSINGNTSVPTPWAGQCDSASTTNLAGAEVECSTCWDKQGVASQVNGDPAVETDTTLQAQTLTDWGEVGWENLKEKANKVYTHGSTVTTLAPATTVDPMTALPACDRSVKSNWGAPTVPTHVCHSYWPIIYAEGDLILNGNAVGQGLLLVEGNLFMRGGFQFYGVVLVKKHLTLEGTAVNAAKVTGSVVVAGQTAVGDSITNSRVSGDGNIQYSACSVMRAKQWADLSKKEPLQLRAWTEALY